MAPQHGARSVLVMWLIKELALSESDAFAWYALLATALLAAPLAGGLLALFTGPHVLMVCGSALLVAGYGGLSLVPSVPLAAPLVLLVLGQGLQRPAVYAIAGAQFGGPLANARTVTFVAIMGGVDMGAFTSALLVGTVADWYLGYGGAFALPATAMFVVTLLSGLVWALDRQRTQVQDQGDPTTHRLGMSLAVLPLAVAFSMGLAAFGHHIVDDVAWIGVLVPVVGIPILGLLVLGRARPVPALPVIGGALLAMVPLVGLLFGSSQVLLAACALLSALGLCIGAFGLSKLTGDVPLRWAPLLVAAWLATGWLGDALVYALGAWLGEAGVLGFAVAVCAVAGLAAFALHTLERDPIAS